MSITRKDALRIFQEMADNIETIYSKKWEGHDFHNLKLMSTTEKGNMGEDFLSNILKKCGYENVEVVKGRRGQYDVEIKDAPNTAQFEVKVATEDIHSNFQFNGVRYDTNYTHLFCLGISPNDIKYLIINKNDLNQHTLVSMAKGSNASFKLTKSKDVLRNFNIFNEEIKEVTGS